MMDSRTSRSRGFGYIKFKDDSSVDAILNQNVHIVDRKTVDPKRCNVNMKGKNRRSLKIFVGGIALEHDETTIRDFFSSYGRVTEVNLLSSPNKPRHRGFAFVGFEDEEVVKKLINTHYLNINGKQVEVKAMEPPNGQRACFFPMNGRPLRGEKGNYFATINVPSGYGAWSQWPNGLGPPSWPAGGRGPNPAGSPPWNCHQHSAWGPPGRGDPMISPGPQTSPNNPHLPQHQAFGWPEQRHPPPGQSTNGWLHPQNWFTQVDPTGSRREDQSMYNPGPVGTGSQPVNRGKQRDWDCLQQPNHQQQLLQSPPAPPIDCNNWPGGGGQAAAFAAAAAAAASNWGRTNNWTSPMNGGRAPPDHQQSSTSSNPSANSHQNGNALAMMAAAAVAGQPHWLSSSSNSSTNQHDPAGLKLDESLYRQTQALGLSSNGNGGPTVNNNNANNNTPSLNPHHHHHHHPSSLGGGGGGPAPSNDWLLNGGGGGPNGGVASFFSPPTLHQPPVHLYKR